MINVSSKVFCVASVPPGRRFHFHSALNASCAHICLIFSHSAALFTTICAENSACIHGPWFFVVVTIAGLALSLFFLVSSSKPDVSFFDGALQVISLYFQLCEYLYAFISLAFGDTFSQWALS